MDHLIFPILSFRRERPRKFKMAKNKKTKKKHSIFSPLLTATCNNAGFYIPAETDAVLDLPYLDQFVLGGAVTNPGRAISALCDITKG